MEATPELPPDDPPPQEEEPQPYTLANKVTATLGILACCVLAFMFADVIASGRLTQLVSPPPPEVAP